MAETHSIDDAPGPSLVAPGAQSIRGNILLVEDHSGMNSLLAFLLQRTGHQVTSVKTNVEALQQIRDQSFDLFLLGHQFPDGTELSLCKQLRQARPDKPIILYSTAALFSEQQEGLKAGATAYLAKPEDLFNAGQIAADMIRDQMKRARPHIRAA